jgi:hypothetical protein
VRVGSIPLSNNPEFIEGLNSLITRGETPGLKKSKKNNPDLVEGLNKFTKFISEQRPPILELKNEY